MYSIHPDNEPEASPVRHNPRPEREAPTFQDLIESAPGGRKKTSTRWTTALSALVQATLIAMAFLLPLLGPQSLHATLGSFTMLAPLPPPGPLERPRQPDRPMASLIPAKLKAPHLLSKRIATIRPLELPPDPGLSGTSPGPLVGTGVLGGILAGSPIGVASLPLLRVGGQVMEGRRLDDTIPVYPPEAIKNGVMGTVVVQAIISREGRVVDLHVISGDPMLVQAALDCIAQFRYEPTLLNGVPAEVETTINVVFRLIPSKHPHKK